MNISPAYVLRCRSTNTIMPECSVKAHADDYPWMMKDLKRSILQRQKAYTAGKMSLFKLLRNKVNREMKHCRKSYYKAKVQQLSDSKPRDWWREVKQLCGLKTEKNLRSILRINCDDNDQDLANRINETFISIMNGYSALPEDLCFPNDGDKCIQVTVDSVRENLRQIDKSKASGPTNLVLSQIYPYLVLIDFYNGCIRSVVEYACEVFHSNLSTYLSDELERVQRRAMRIIFPGMKYREALQQGHLQSLYDGREYLCTKLFR